MRLAPLLGLLAHGFTALAQTATLSNDTNVNAVLNATNLRFSMGSLSPGSPIAFASDANAGQVLSSQNALNSVMLANTTIFLTTPNNVNQLVNNSIAYISCDPQSYQNSNLGLQYVMTQAQQKISTPANPNAGAIILYSKVDLWCNFTATDGYNYTQVFVFPGTANTIPAEQALGNGPMTASIFPANTVGPNGPTQTQGDNNPNTNPGSMNTPSTTVAMIILYSVTGIITLCFIVVIVTGALRARRHPERYGLLNVAGNTPQRRARGIARAMLESIPIVKFGEKEPVKPAGDVEQGIEMQPVTQAEKSVVTDKPKDGEASSETIDTPQTAAEATQAAAEDPSRANSSTPVAPVPAPHTDGAADLAAEDNGLACSVCTEDFVKGEDLRVLPCDHKFHPECIDPWLLNISGTCPLCRIDLRPPEDREEQPAAADGAQAAVAQADGSAAQTAQPGSASTPAPRFSTFLSRHNMGAATPAQRIRALRDLRNHRRNGTTPAIDGTAGAATDSSAPRSSRVSRLFNHGTSSAPSPPVLPPSFIPTTVEPPRAPSTSTASAGQAGQAAQRPVPSLYQMTMGMRRGR